MLTLKDLSADKELDRKALAEVRGGSVYNYNAQGASSFGAGGLVGVSEVTQGQSVFNTDNDFYKSEGYAFNIGSPFGFALA
ncbi:MAG: hypothetical protein P8178_18960 [Candidatus Thiodiazotropha sp.]